jgi:hypothetical protein
MPGHISEQRDAEKDLTTITVTGDVEFSQVNEHIQNFLKGTPTRLVLWDLRKGSLMMLSQADLKRLVSESAPHAQRRCGGRTAILVDSIVDFGLARMFEIIAEVYHIPFAIAVFRHRDKAMEWLLADGEPIAESRAPSAGSR